MRTRFVNGTQVDCTGERPCGIVTEAGLISVDTLSPCDVTVDLNGCVLMPALVDMHCHLRDPGWPQKETLETGLRAAAAGGFGTVCAMANTSPVMDNAAAVVSNVRRAESLELCRLIQAAAAGRELKDAEPTDYAELSSVTPVVSNDGQTIFSDTFMERLLAASERHGFMVSTHCMPEAEIISRDITLSKRVGGRLHVGHISLAESARLIRDAKRQGVNITCEVMPHHLFGWDDAYRVNPPMRTRKDALALIDAIRDGTVDCLATDHAPHTEEDKANGAAGISNFDHALAMLWQVFRENKISLSTLSRLASKNPARLLGQNCGALERGMRADLIVFDPDARWEIRRDAMLSRSHNTPFEGRQVCGRVIKTFIGGKLVYDNGAFV